MTKRGRPKLKTYIATVVFGDGSQDLTIRAKNKEEANVAIKETLKGYVYRLVKIKEVIK